MQNIGFSRFQGEISVMNNFLEYSMSTDPIPFSFFLRQNMNVVKLIFSEPESLRELT